MYAKSASQRRQALSATKAVYPVCKPSHRERSNNQRLSSRSKAEGCACVLAHQQHVRGQQLDGLAATGLYAGDPFRPER